MGGDKPIKGFYEYRPPREKTVEEIYNGIYKGYEKFQPLEGCECCGCVQPDDASFAEVSIASESPEPLTLWVKGYVDESEYGAWQICGVFSCETLARESCTSRDEFIGPILLNQNLSNTREVWPGAYYPKR